MNVVLIGSKAQLVHADSAATSSHSFVVCASKVTTINLAMGGKVIVMRPPVHYIHFKLVIFHTKQTGAGKNFCTAHA